MSKYPHFNQAVRDLAPTNKERAAKLGVSVRTLYYYLQGKLPPIEVVKRHPTLDHALTLDLAAEYRSIINARDCSI